MEENKDLMPAEEQESIKEEIQVEEVQTDEVVHEIQENTQEAVETETQANVENEAQVIQENIRYCIKCGEKLPEGTVFCPKCGQKVGEKASDPKLALLKDKKKILIIAGAVVAVVLLGLIIHAITSRAAKAKEAEQAAIEEEAGPDFQAIYDEYCSSSYATVGSDGSYLSIDTNPLDRDDYSDSEAIAALISVNDALGLPESVINQMSKTRALDGTQDYTTDELYITWNYHPDNGLEVTYSKK